MTNTPSTIDIETELSAVNSILGSIGQSPITALDFTNPEISFIFNLLKESNIDVQNEGWVYNKEDHVEFVPDSSTGYILFPNDILRICITNGYQDRFRDLVKRNGRVYDKVNHTDVFEQSLFCDVVRLFNFEDLPSVFKRYITYKAASRAATQLVSNSDLYKLLAVQEESARAACMDYECTQGKHTIFGYPEESFVSPYQPFRAIIR